MSRTRGLIGAGIILLLMIVTFTAGWTVATLGIGAGIRPSSLSELERQFTERMRGAAMVGWFTVAGGEDRPFRPDRYNISSVQKVGDDRWRFNARMDYHGAEVTLPVTVVMKWAADTPMITLTDFTIPTMGTFTVRLFFYGDRYAGTWQHGRAGGHMFGRIERQTTQLH